MAKWKCVSSTRGTYIPVGTIIDATEVLNQEILVTETKRKMNGDVLLGRGELLPIKGQLWSWEETK